MYFQKPRRNSEKPGRNSKNSKNLEKISKKPLATLCYIPVMLSVISAILACNIFIETLNFYHFSYHGIKVTNDYLEGSP